MYGENLKLTTCDFIHFSREDEYILVFVVTYAGGTVLPNH